MDLSVFLNKCNRFEKRKNFQKLLIAYRNGCKMFPEYQDSYGDPYFSKQYLRKLLDLNELKEALRFYQSSNYPSLLILFIGFWYKHQNYSQAKLAILKFLQLHPMHKECIDISDAIEANAPFDQFGASASELKFSYDMLPTYKERLKFYLGRHIARKNTQTFERSSIQSYLNTQDVKVEVKNCIYDRARLEKDALSGAEVTKVYHGRLLAMLDRCNINPLHFPFVYGDLPADHPLIPFPYLTKTRSCISKKYGTILKLLNEPRHWESFYKISKMRLIPFGKRKKKVVWRGATTGFHRNESSRFAFVEKYFGFSGDFDIGFSSIVQSASDCAKYKVNELSIDEMCSFKYIVSISGNDKDSGLNWKLASGSVVIMPKPKNYSWLAEKFLIPGVHYIQMNDDFSDLPGLIDWCNENQSECEKIALNAKIYMTQFLDNDMEDRLQRQVLELFFDRFDLKD